MRRASMWLAILGIALSAPPPAGATDESTVTQPYVGSSVAVQGQPVAEQLYCIRSLVQLVAPDLDAPDAGGACFSDAFATPPLHDRVDLRIDDAVADHVVGRYTISDFDFTVLASGYFCDTVDDVELTAEAWHLDVAVFADPVSGGVCAGINVPPSHGTVTARFFTEVSS